ncbi:hypothetical protein [Lysobacter sp. A3-1-A15]|uniref:hypothetical protein n=1 Tax=Novilysobacter viscosus TaxID=3098602 RepID=UPI002EDBA17A
MFQFSESNLARAGTLLLLEHGCAMAVGLVLIELQIDDRGLIFLGIWLVNLVTAWYLYKAALSQGRHRAAWYGIISALAPMFALLSFLRLYLHDRLTLMAGTIQRSRDEA